MTVTNMSASPSLSSRPREPTSSHLHSSSRTQRPTQTARTSSVKTPGTIAQSIPLPPSRVGNELRTPFQVTASQDARTPSPNYFGLTVDPNANVFSSSAAKHSRENWSPPTSDIRSTAVASPRIIPVDANPAFEAFRRQSENHKFSLGNFHSTIPPTSNPAIGKEHAEKPVTPPQQLPLSPRALESTGPHSEMKRNSPKRHLSSDSSMFPDRPRRGSPASFSDGQEALFLEQARMNAPSLPAMRIGMPSSKSHSRSETLPSNLEDGAGATGPTIVTPQHVVNLIESASEEILLLDLRVSTHYARSHIVGSINLCIPTTLLKRPSFNVAKLAETFKDAESKKKFEGWRSSRYIIVYDPDSVQLKDAAICVNTLKKFTSEGWSGCSYIIRGGFAEFSSTFPRLVSGGSRSSSGPGSPMSSSDSDAPAVVPVAGGCPMPATKNAANPFFGNIRQNMDLIGGVGQMPIKRPVAMTEETEQELPVWLRQAMDFHNEGKIVSDKFLQIEKREQRRMQEALSSNVTYGSPHPDSATQVKVAGIEKGTKNRYNNIWPYEHSRVKLEGVNDGDCDYINASHVKASWSTKHYISTQGPLPATFTDFWEMVWQQNARVVVMLTAESEGGQLKAHNYWSDKRFGPLRLSFLSEHKASLEPEKIHGHKNRRAAGQRRSTVANTNQLGPPKEVPTSTDQPFVTVRKFTLSHSDHPFERMREITQLQYSSWPDFGAPAHPAHLLGLVEQCDVVVRSYSSNSPKVGEAPIDRPIVVHCSAGCGRTGTFCTVDTVIDMLRRQRRERQEKGQTRSTASRGNGHEIEMVDASNPFFASGHPTDASWSFQDNVDLIEKTVEEFRNQRLSMVQSLRQFVLCYETVLEWLVEQHPKTA